MKNKTKATAIVRDGGFDKLLVFKLQAAKISLSLKFIELKLLMLH